MVPVKTTVDHFLMYLQRRDLENLVNLFSDDVTWQIPGNTEEIAWLGNRSSKAEVRTCFELLWAATEPVSADIKKMMIDGSDVVIVGSFATRMLKTNKVVSSVFFIHFVVDDGKIAEYTLLEDSYAVSMALLN